jgi:PhnB protein
MEQATPYLNFFGNCEEAMNFYKDVFGADESSIMRFSEMPPNPEFPIPDEAKNLVMHSHLKKGDFSLMASDAIQPGSVGTNIALSLNFTDANQQTDLFNKLSDGGQVTMPLQDTFWGARFGQCTDRFGIQWMFNKENPQQ